VYDNGAYCDTIPRSLPGIAYVQMDGSPEPVRVRAAYVTDEEIQAMARDYRPPRALRSIDPADTDRTEMGDAA
jgi:S-DNA-T family DNA segregation ATPase FtsK/SpoIIIE